MIESLQRVKNLCWADCRFHPTPDSTRVHRGMGLAGLQGQFALVHSSGDTVTLTRDPLGCNKLFFTIQDHSVVTANYIVDLVQAQIPFDTIYSVPAGHALTIDFHRRTVALDQYFNVHAAARDSGFPLADAARNIRVHLELWFSRLARQFGHRRICVCLSGGLDSSLIAALAVRYFPNVTAYTYGYSEPGRRETEDVRYARQVADFIGLPLRIVRATAADVMDALDDALQYGQDWREFNVHCAIVNEILARSIASDAGADESSARPLVLTGDLSNELLADYSPLVHAGIEVYRLPRVSPERLRAALIEGLDAGDREIGIFSHRGLDVLQPYGLVAAQYLQLPTAAIGGDRSKQTLVREIAGDLLPEFIFTRRKVRAQVGEAHGPGGIVSTLLSAGRDARWLRAAFARHVGATDQKSLDQFIRLGRYRFPRVYPERRH